MKKLYLFFGMFLISAAVFAQNKKGTVLLGGSFSYHYHQQDNPDGTQHKDHRIATYPTAGIFIKDTWATGIQMVYAYSHQFSSLNNGVEHKSEGTTLGGKAFLKKYFLIGEKAAFTASLEAGAERITIKSHDNSQVNPIYANYTVGIRPGFSYFITKKIGLEGNIGFLGYNYGRDNIGGKITRHQNFNLDINPGSLHFGIYFFL